MLPIRQIELLIPVAGQPQDKVPRFFCGCARILFLPEYIPQGMHQHIDGDLICFYASSFFHPPASFPSFPDHNIPHLLAESYWIFRKKSTFFMLHFLLQRALFISVPAVFPAAFSLFRILLIPQIWKTHLRQIPVPALQGSGSSGC